METIGGSLTIATGDESLMEAMQAWSAIATVACTAPQAEETGMETTEMPVEAIRTLMARDQGGVLCEFYLKTLEIQFHEQLLPNAWQQLKLLLDQHPAERQLQLEPTLHAALKRLSKTLQQHTEILHQVWESLPLDCVVDNALLLNRYRSSAAASIMTSCPVGLSELLQEYYAMKLEQFAEAVDMAAADGLDEEPEPDAIDSLAYMGDSVPPNPWECVSREWMCKLIDVTRGTHLLGLEPICEEAWTAVLRSHMQSHLRQHAAGIFNEPFLDRAQQHLHFVPLNFLKSILPPWDGGDLEWGVHPAEIRLQKGPVWSAKMLQWRSWMLYFLYETLGELRISEMFDIVVDFPDSQPAVLDMFECLQHTNLHSKLIHLFCRSISSRLLQPGASTSDIIQQYVLTIRALRSLDPSGTVVEAVGKPIREYLRLRPDTIRCLVTMLTEDGEADGRPSSAPSGGLLLNELQRPPDSTAAGAEQQSSCRDDDVLRVMEAWKPLPADVEPNPASATDGGDAPPQADTRPMAQDIVGILMKIYGDDQFIEEYRSMLAGKLLQRHDFEMEHELRTVELLKLRFGEAKLHHCEVMLKDCADSKRFYSGHVQPAAAPAASPEASSLSLRNTSVLVFSELFWPELPEPAAELQLPAEVQEVLIQYHKKFQEVKAPRKLVLTPHLGVVSLSLSVGGRQLDVSVAPAQAAIVLHFRDRELWPAAELANTLGLSQEDLRRRALFWVHAGVLREVRAPQLAYRRVDHLPDQVLVGGPHGGVLGDLMEEDGQDVAGNQAAMLQEMQPFQQYIINVIRNMAASQPMTTASIHTLLTRICINPRYNRSQEELSNFLDHLVDLGKLRLERDQYRMPS